MDANEEGQDHTAYWIRGICPLAARHLRGDGFRRRQVAKRHVGGLTARRRASARNVILFIGDGMSMAHRTAARMLSKGMVEGRYGGELAIDDMPHMALVSTSGTDSIVTELGQLHERLHDRPQVVRQRHGRLLRAQQERARHPKVETIAELAKRRNGGMAVGVVTNTEIEDATPAGMVAHVRRRSDYDDIVRMFYEAKPDVMMGGGTAYFLPKSDPGRQAQGRGELPREVQGGRVPLCGHRYGDEGCRRRQGDAHACSASSIPATSTARSIASC